MFTRYQPRPLLFLGVESVEGYLLKIYAIHEPDQVFDPVRFADRWELITGILPQPPSTEERPGVGFAILHQASRVDYLIVSW